MSNGRHPQPRNGRSDGAGAHRTFHRTLVDDTITVHTASANDKNSKSAVKSQPRRPSVPNERARHQKNAAAYEQAAEYAAKSEAQRVVRFGTPSADAWTTIEVEDHGDDAAPAGATSPRAEAAVDASSLGSGWETIPAPESAQQETPAAALASHATRSEAAREEATRSEAVATPSRAARRGSAAGAAEVDSGRAPDADAEAGALSGSRGNATRGSAGASGRGNHAGGNRQPRNQQAQTRRADRRGDAGRVDRSTSAGRSRAGRVRAANDAAAASGSRARFAGTGAASGNRQRFADALSSLPRPGHAGRKNPEQAQRRSAEPNRPSPHEGRHSSVKQLGRGAIVAVIVVLLLIIALADGCSHMGRAYAGVTVGDIDVSGMNHDEIVTALADEYGGYATKTVTVYASQQARDEAQSGSGDGTMKQLENAATATQVSSSDASASQTQWSATAASLGAQIDYDQLADEALAVGRSNGGWQARWGSQHGKASIPVEMNISSDQVESLASQIDQTIGTPRVDTSVTVSNGVAQVQAGTDGMLVDRDWLSNQIEQALMADGDTSIVAETMDAPSRITADEAQQTADQINRAIAGGAQISSEGITWQATAAELGSIVRTDEVQADDGSWDLVPSVDQELAKPLILLECGDADVGNLTVSFSVSDGGDVTVRTTGSGKTLSTPDAADELQQKLFGPDGRAWSQDASVPVTVQVGTMDVPQEMPLDEAEDLGVVTTLGSYTTTYSNTAGTEARNTNIHLAADIINNTVCAAGQQWSFNDRAGDCNEERGFQAAGAIINDEYVDSIGGGICQVATTVFNAVYESGLQVDSRTNHSLYISSYPAGRDAAVSYPELDLKWSDQFTSDVLLQMSYTDTTVTAKIIGMSTGYTVTSDVGEWQAGQSYTTKFEVDDTLPTGSHYTKTTGTDGRSISVTRTVRDQNGNVVIKDTFNSVYQPKNEVIYVGPNTDTSNLGTSS